MPVETGEIGYAATRGFFFVVVVAAAAKSYLVSFITQS